MIPERNNTENTQYTYHSDLGVMSRNKGAIFFRPKKYITKRAAQRKPGFIDVADIQGNLLVASSYRKKQTHVCSGCGKEFPVDEMDGDYCRGFDGCSAKKEIREELDISNYMYKDAETLCHVRG